MTTGGKCYVGYVPYAADSLFTIQPRQRSIYYIIKIGAATDIFWKGGIIKFRKMSWCSD